MLREQQSQGKDVVRVEGRGDPHRGVGETVTDVYVENDEIV